MPDKARRDFKTLIQTLDKDIVRAYHEGTTIDNISEMKISS